MVKTKNILIMLSKPNDSLNTFGVRVAFSSSHASSYHNRRNGMSYRKVART